MKIKICDYYILALVLTLCCVISCLSAKEGYKQVLLCREMTNALNASQNVTEAYAENEVHYVVDVEDLSALVEEYVRLRIENVAQQGYIESFNEFWRDEYNFDAAQEQAEKMKRYGGE